VTIEPAGRHAPQPHDESQVRVPEPPQLLVQELVEPAGQVQPSSVDPSQSSSTPLQVSVGGEQTPQEQDAEQV
jgi:hypothetical protein